MSDHRKSRQKPQEAAGGHLPDAATKDTPPNLDEYALARSGRRRLAVRRG